MSLLEFFIYITLINWSIVTLLWLFIKKKDQFYLKDLYWGVGIALLALSAVALQGLLEVSDFHVRKILVTLLALVLGIKVFLFTNKKRTRGCFSNKNNFRHFDNPCNSQCFQAYFFRY
jgi:steroid 5-alpha reductase family enzyme